MADELKTKRLSELPLADALGDVDALIGNQNNATKRFLLGQIKDWVLSFMSNTRTLESFGAKGDSTGSGQGTDDSSAFQRALDWLAAGPNRTVTDGGGRYRLSAPCSVNFNKSNQPGNIKMIGAICPDPGIGKALSILNGWGGEYILRVYGGGQTADYTQPDPSGADQAFFFRGNRAANIEVYGTNYLGRLLRVTKAVTGEFPSQQYNIRRICTRESLGLSFTTEQRIASAVGQAFYIDTQSVAFGEIGNATCFFDRYGPKIVDTTDVKLGSIDALWIGNSGMEALGAISHHYGSISAGEGNFPMLRIGDGTTQSSQNVRIDDLFLIKGSINLILENIGNAGGLGVTIGKVHSQQARVVGMQINTCKNFDIGFKSSGDLAGVQLIGSCNYGLLRHSIDLCKNTAIDIGSLCQNITSSGTVGDGDPATAATFPLIKVRGTLFNSFDALVTSSGNNSALYDLVASNSVSILGGSMVSGAKPKMLSSAPKLAANVANYLTVATGTATILAGQSSVTVNHGLASTPSVVNVSGRSAATAGAFAPPASATQITISVASAVASDATVYWEARV